MASNFFKIKKGTNIEPVIGSTVSAEGDLAYNDTSNQLEVFGASAAEALTTASNTQTLTNKTLSGNTAATLVSGAGTLALNTSGTATVPNATDTLVGKATTDVFTNKTFDVDATGNVLSNIANANIKAAAGIAYSKLNLTGGVVNADINASAAIAYSKLNLTGAILNADLAGSISLTTKVAGILPIANGGTAVSSVTTAPTASSFAGWDANSNLFANHLFDSFLETTASGGTLTLTAASPKIHRILIGTGSHTVVMPAGATVPIGSEYTFYLPTGGTITFNSVTPSLITTAVGPGRITLMSTTASGGGGYNNVDVVRGISLGGTGATTAAGAISAISPITTTGDMIYSSSGTTNSRLAVGSANQVIKSVNGLPTWSAAPSGAINYISANPDAEVDTTGWTTYADSAQNTPVDGTGGSPSSTWTRNVATTLRGAAQFLWTRTANNRQGEGVAYAFTLDKADFAKPIAISFDYILASGTFVAADGTTAPLNDGTTSQNAGMSDLEVFIYDVTNSALIPVTPQILTYSSTVTPGTFKGTFQASSNGTSYRLILHTARSTAVAFTMSFDSFFVGPQDQTSSSYDVAANGSMAATTVGSAWTQLNLAAPLKDSNGSVSGNTYVVQTPGFYEFGGILYAGGTFAFAVNDRWGFGYSINNASVDNAFNEFRSSASATLTGVTSGVQQKYLNAGDIIRFFGINTGGNRTLSTADSFYFVRKVASSGIGPEGRVIAAQYTNTAGTSITSTPTALPFATRIYDLSSSYVGSTGIYTCPISGIYEVSATISTTSVANTANNGLYLYLYKNAALSSYIAQTNQQATATLGIATQGVTTAQCNAGDTLAVYVMCDDNNKVLRTNAGHNTVSIRLLSGPSAALASQTFSAKYNTSTSAVGTSSAVAIYTVKEWDTHSAYSTGTGLYTIPCSGKWRVGTILSAGAVQPTTIGHAILQYASKNGADSNIITAQIAQQTSASIQILSSAGYAEFNCVAGDTLSIRTVRDSGVPATSLSGGAGAAWVTFDRIGN